MRLFRRRCTDGGRHASYVDRELPVELAGVRRRIAHLAGHEDPGIVDEDVEAAEALHDGLDQSVHLSGVALVHLEGHGANAFTFELADDRLRLVGRRRVADGDVRAVFR